jgi:hypothetical protein
MKTSYLILVPVFTLVGCAHVQRANLVYPSGTREEVTFYTKGGEHVLHGKLKLFRADGSLRGVQHFTHGVASRTWDSFWTSGQLRSRTKVRNGRPIQQHEFDRDGRLVEESIREIPQETIIVPPEDLTTNDYVLSVRVIPSGLNHASFEIALNPNTFDQLSKMSGHGTSLVLRDGETTVLKSPLKVWRKKDRMSVGFYLHTRYIRQASFVYERPSGAFANPPTRYVFDLEPYYVDGFRPPTMRERMEKLGTNAPVIMRRESR